MPWCACRDARRQELKFLCDLGTYENVTNVIVTEVNTRWIDTRKSFEEEPMQIRPRLVA